MNTTQIQCLWVEAKIKFTTLLICLVYIPPPVVSHTVELFYENLVQHNIADYDKNLLIIGDFNMWRFSTTREGTNDVNGLKEEILEDACSLFNLESHNTIQNSFGRILDLVLYRHVTNPNVKRSVMVEVGKGEPLVTEVPRGTKLLLQEKQNQH
uniref:Endonuclease/exonuclease/phosphatase domain-containing protein n=1 Tax=Cacopsylla melanoneura TaxID=428564 RepID=A0A8D9E644_9HEMI